MAIEIISVDKASPAEKAGILAGDKLVSINKNKIADVLDYRFYMTEKKLSVDIIREGKELCIFLTKGEYDDLGLQFETYLMDKQHSCKNKCIFCFVEQLPKGLRQSLYFKDDDSRLSFLFGNYITLTNCTEQDIERIIKMRISPINISVHTTDPDLRVKMMANPAAADSLRFIPMLTKAGIKVNTQLVVCPGYNDGEQLKKTLSDGNAIQKSLRRSRLPVRSSLRKCIRSWNGILTIDTDF